MHLSAAYKYQLSEHKRPVLIFYITIFALLMFMFIGTIQFSPASDGVRMGGLDFATAIFLFVASLCSFKEPFLMLLQNGVSRKSVFEARILVALTVAGFMAVIDKLLLLLGKAVMVWSGRFAFYSLYEQAYPSRALKEGALSLHFNIFIFDFLLYLALLSIGYFITIMFYRLNKAGKIAVGAGVPVGLTIVLPIIDSTLFDFKISHAVNVFLDFALGSTSQNPYAAMITFVITFLLFSFIGWLLMRKAVIKS